MARRLLLCLLLFPLLAAPAGADDIYHRKRELDQRLNTLHARIARAQQQEGVLTQQITVFTAKIRALENDVQSAQTKLNRLASELAVRQHRLAQLNELFTLQTKKLSLLRRAYSIALERVEKRLVEAYETPSVSTVDVVLSTRSFGNLLDELEYVNRIASQNKEVSDELFRARTEMHDIRERTRKTKHAVAVETDAVRERVATQHSVTQALISSQQQLASARATKRDSLSSVRESEKEWLEESRAVAAASAAIEAKLSSAQSGASSGDGTPSASGLIWPVQGPITSPFGPRWGGFHPGIDIAAPTGTPIRAAAAGRVIQAGWFGGYGNFTVIDHGNGLATAYAHQTSFAVGAGVTVAQGQVIGYVGSTGFSTGPHVHFEVRVNGAPQNPFNYL